MLTNISRPLFLLALCLLLIAPLHAQTRPTSAKSGQPESIQQLYDAVRPSLVIVQYTWESELGRREIAGSGIVVNDNGTVMCTLAQFDVRLPDEQMKDFKVLVPSDTGDVEELEAKFLGRDERSDVAFVQATSKEKRNWQPIRFVDRNIAIGDELWSVGLLPKIAGYKAYIMESTASALLRGEMPQVLVSGKLAAIGSPVFNNAGEAVGFVIAQAEQPVLLNDPKMGLSAVSRAPVVFVKSSAIMDSISDPPTGEGLKLPWMGIMQMVGLQKEVAEYFGLKGQTAIQIGDTIPGGPAEQAGIKPGSIIVHVNGKPIPRGDEPEELPMILRRMVLHMNVGTKLTLTLLDPRTREKTDVALTLQERPKQPNLAKRYYAEDLGFSVREMVFMDAYQRKLAPGTKGTVIAMIRPQSAAQTARLEANDMIVELNGQPIPDIDTFTKAYQEFRSAHARDAVVMVVLREGRNQTIRIEPPQ